MRLMSKFKIHSFLVANRFSLFYLRILEKYTHTYLRINYIFISEQRIFYFDFTAISFIPDNIK